MAGKCCFYEALKLSIKVAIAASVQQSTRPNSFWFGLAWLVAILSSIPFLQTICCNLAKNIKANEYFLFKSPLFRRLSGNNRSYRFHCSNKGAIPKSFQPSSTSMSEQPPSGDQPEPHRGYCLSPSHYTPPPLPPAQQQQPNHSNPALKPPTLFCDHQQHSSPSNHESNHAVVTGTPSNAGNVRTSVVSSTAASDESGTVYLLIHIHINIPLKALSC